MWLGREEEQFTQTLEQGTRLLDEHIARAKERGLEGIGAEEAFQLHDTYGFPFDLTLELAAEQDMGVDEAGFEREMEARASARALRGRPRRPATATASAIEAFAERRGLRRPTFTGYETTEQATAVGAVALQDGRVLAKLVESPFYATGGGQVADAGEIRCEDGGCAARVVDVVRLGDDQALVLEPLEGELHEGERVVATRRRRGAPRDPGQPHRDAPAARGAARAPRRATCARPAPTSARTSCASTSPTAPR